MFCSMCLSWFVLVLGRIGFGLKLGFEFQGFGLSVPGWGS